MLYLHFCSSCNRIHILSGHRNFCPACDNVLCELSVPFEHYIKLTPKERQHFLERCANPAVLDKLRVVYVSKRKRKKK